MPELPEVETIRHDLNPLLKNKRVTGLRVKKTRLLKNARSLFSKHLVGATIIKVERRAKILLLQLSSGYTLVIHLKMTGQLVYVLPEKIRAAGKPGKIYAGGHPIGNVNGVPNKFTYIILKLSDGSNLYFNDVRMFGYWRLIKQSELEAALGHLGPEPLLKNFTLEVFEKNLKRRQKTIIKAALLDQTVVAGIGNIYADESLFAAGISPSRRVSTLTTAERKELHKSIKKVLVAAVAARGTSFNSYIDGLGRSGTYWDKRLVYGRKGEPCPRCRKILDKIIVAGRGTTYCRYCQK